jgi:hypothetical protein
MTIPARLFAFVLPLALTIASVTGSPAAECSATGGHTEARARIAKAFTKTITAALRTSVACHRFRDMAKKSDLLDCNEPTIGFYDPALKGFTLAYLKMRTTLAELDADPQLAPLLSSQFPTCPDNCDGHPDLAGPITSYTELGECLTCVAVRIIDDRGTPTLGSPAVPLAKVDRRCHSAIARAYAHRMAAILKTRLACQREEMRIDNCSLQPCDAAGVDEIAEATAEAEAEIDDACTGADLTTIDSCAATTLDDLKTCLRESDDAAAARAFASAFELP